MKNWNLSAILFVAMFYQYPDFLQISYGIKYSRMAHTAFKKIEEIWSAQADHIP